MTIIYCCYGGAHSSVLACAIHLNLLPQARRPTIKEILKLPGFDRMPRELIGFPVYFGTDNKGNKIYYQGMGRAAKAVKRLLQSFMAIEGIPQQEVYLKDTLKYINSLVRIGGFLSRRLGIVFAGRLLVALGLILAYPRFLQAVNEIKKEIGIA